jgi:hypothetical protein
MSNTMTWKKEKWLADVFPGIDKIYSEYSKLPRRELAIIAASVLDVALSELLAMRLLNIPKECEEFLGLNEDGRAPCGSFGAKIQLGLLTGVLTDVDASILRSVKNIRNKIAHRVRSDFTSPDVLPILYSMHDVFLSHSNMLIECGILPGPKHDLSLIRQLLASTPEAGAGLLLAVLSVYQGYFHRISEFIPRVEKIVTPAVTDK